MKPSSMSRAMLRLLAGVAPLVCLAVDNVFTNSGLWTEPSLWSLGHIPASDELAWINGAATLDVPQSTAGLNIQGSLGLSGDQAQLTSLATVQVGCFATNGTLAQTGGRFTAGSNFYVGESTTGRVQFADAAVTVTNVFVVGHNAKGVGTYDQQGGTLDLRATSVVGSGTSTTFGWMTLTNVVMTCTNNNSFTVGNTATAYFAVTNSTLLLTDFSVANPVGGAKGTAVVVGTSVSARDITSANNTNTVGSLSFDTCSVAARNLYAGRKYKANGWIGISRSTVTCGAPIYVGEESGSRGQLVVNQNSALSTTSIHAGRDAEACGHISLNDSTADTLTLYAGYYAAATGSVTLASGSLSASSGLYVGNNGVGVFSNLAGTVRTALLGVSYSADTAVGYMYCGPDSATEVTTAAFQVGRYGSGVFDCYGAVNVQAPNLGLFVGNLSSAVGIFNLYPGARLSVSNQLILGYTTGSGTFNQFGGEAFFTNTIFIGGNNASFTTAKGFMNLYGGALTALKPVYVGRCGSGELTVSGGTATLPDADLGLTVGTFAGATGRVYLVNGTLATGRTRGVNGYSEFFFDGGTLQTLADRTDFMAGLTKAEVRQGGAIIDSNSRDITITQSIAHDSRVGAPAKDGGLTKLGAGTLTMTGTLGFTGDLGADGGTLNLSGATYSLASGSGLWGSGTLVPPTGGLSVSSGGFVAPGGTNGVGTLTVNGNLTVNGETRITISPDGATCGTLAVTGTLLFPAGSSLVIQNPEDMVERVNYTFASATAFSGTPALANLPGKWAFKTDNNQLRAVYISGTVISLR